MAQVEFAGSKGIAASLESGTYKLLAPGVNMTFKGLRKLGWKEELKGEPQRGNGPLALGRTIGEYEASCDVEQLQTEYNHMVETMSALGLTALTLTATWREGRKVQRIEIPDALIKSVEGEVSQGGGVIVIKYTLDVNLSPIKTNGKTLLDLRLLNTPRAGLLTASR